MFARRDVRTIRIDIPLRSGGRALKFVTNDDASCGPWWEELLEFLHGLQDRTDPLPSGLHGNLVERVELNAVQRSQLLELIQRAPENEDETQQWLRLPKLHLPLTDRPVRVMFFAHPSVS